MLDYLADKASDRKLRLLACLCCRRIWDVIPTDESRRCVEVAELFAEGLASRDDLDASIQASMAACERLPRPRRPGAVDAINAVSRVHRGPGGGRNAALGLAASAWASAEAFRTRRLGETPDAFAERRVRLLGEELARQTHLVRELFGNPFRPVAFSPEWRTDTALSLTRQMYDAREFSAMPIMADALQDAGCDNDDILAHCRDANATHVRGCWVVDLVRSVD
jgi:hypothetical protein